jgi:hypothetical protein
MPFLNPFISAFFKAGLITQCVPHSYHVSFVQIGCLGLEPMAEKI